MYSVIIYIIIGAVLSAIDYKTHVIPNVIVVPAVLIGAILTHNWGWAVMLFIWGAYLFAKGVIMGGDVKLLAMVGAFLGPIGAGAVFLSFIVSAFLHVIKARMVLPFAPVVYTVSLVLMATNYIWQGCHFMVR